MADPEETLPVPVQTKVVNIPSPAAFWSMSVKVRDSDQCVVCQSKDELSVQLLDGFAGISTDDGRINLDAGATLCAACKLKAVTDHEFLLSVPSYMDYHPTTRMNFEVPRDLYAKFVAVCRLRGTSISRALRGLVNEQLDEVEDGKQPS